MTYSLDYVIVRKTISIKIKSKMKSIKRGKYANDKLMNKYSLNSLINTEAFYHK